MSIALTRAIKALSEGLGFHACGIAPALSLAEAPLDSPLRQAYERYVEWLQAGMHAGMEYMARTAPLRADPRQLLPGAKSLILVLQSYFHTPRAASPIAQYAWGEDYHIHMRRRLQIIADYLQRHGHEARPFVDTAPILEKVWAVASGLGWIGKNTLLLNRHLGSYTFIGGLITTASLIPDAPFTENLCGTCNRCIQACPTQALTPYKLDARRCIAYWTIEAPTLEEGMPNLHGWIFGCDICQQVCPWNRFAKPQGELSFRPKAAVFQGADYWTTLTPSQVKKLQQGSALRRAHPKKLLQIATISASQASKGSSMP
ncbi:MAG: tRNA epoxyqueuosine(34) reductase QueG [Bacteroidia bacterium]|nr:tRNA epoxyqueuosine(34) reductase QueG [Bacteroidia bacterium]MCX7763721.1 tRNA epoxyqueuosine(34) reductase QueG [Bacteroidia bacterium]